jgi:hypothetical protein
VAVVLVASALLLWVIYAAIWHLSVRPAIRRTGRSDVNPPAAGVEGLAEHEEEIARRRRVAVAASDPQILD